MSKHHADIELQGELKIKPAREINKKLRALNIDEIRDGEEACIALAEYRIHDAQEATALFTSTFAGAALLAAVSKGGVSVTMWTFVLISVAFAGLSAIHIGKRNQGAANAVLRYRLNKGLPLKGPDREPTDTN